MPKLNSERAYALVREKWTHEDHLINHRITWLLVSQALFFASYGVFISLDPASGFIAKATKLVTVIPILGMIITVTAGASILAAVVAQRSLNKFTFEDDGLDGEFGVSTHTEFSFLGHMPAVLLPLSFLISWVAVLVA